MVTVILLFVETTIVTRCVLTLIFVAFTVVIKVRDLLKFICKALLTELLSLQLVSLLNFDACLNALLDAWVVWQHASFCVFDGDLPFVEDLLLVHDFDSFVGSLAGGKHDVAEALGNVRVVVAD